jgi:hypothetical protein
MLTNDERINVKYYIEMDTNATDIQIGTKNKEATSLLKGES